VVLLDWVERFHQANPNQDHRAGVASTKVECDGPGWQRALHVKAATA
jgi:hypothetical protein